MRICLRNAMFVLLMLVGAAGFSSQALAQPSGEGFSEEALSKLSDLQTAAGQLAAQQGQFAGRSVGPQFGSATTSLVQILTNFDIWACGSAVTALGIKHRRLAIAAAGAMPADPALDRAVVDMGNIIAQLQELCNRYVFDAGSGGTGAGTGTATDGSGATGAGEGTATGGETATPEPPRLTVQERICYERCGDLYRAYLQAERDYNQHRRWAEQDRATANSRRQTASAAASAAAAARQHAEDVQREYDQQQAALTAATTQAERMRIAERISHLYPDGARQAAEDAQQAADQAEAAASEAEARATRSEARASALYDALLEIYNALKHCAEDCARQAHMYDGVDVDIGSLFPSMPRTAPSRPPFYHAPPAPRQVAPAPRTERQQSSAASQVLMTPMALSGGMLVGAVFDEQGEPRENTRIALDPPKGRKIEQRTDSSGRFAMAVPAIVGTVTLTLPDNKEDKGQKQEVEIVESVPDYLQALPPEFISVGSRVTVGRPYRSASVQSESWPEMDVPVATAIGPDRETGLTSFDIPPSLPAGPVEVSLETLDGQEVVTQSTAVRYISASLERDKLSSGDLANFTYELDFGKGPKLVYITVQTTGPVSYEHQGEPQPLEIGPDGHAMFTDRIRALQGSPTGIPFSIVATFSEGQ